MRLEHRLAEFMRKESAVTFATGFQVNLGAIACLVGKGDSVYLDKQDHACIIDGARLSFGEVRKYRHNDPSDLRRQMHNDTAAKGRFIVVDGVFSMEGDIAPLPEIVAVGDASSGRGSWSTTPTASAFSARTAAARPSTSASRTTST